MSPLRAAKLVQAGWTAGNIDTRTEKDIPAHGIGGYVVKHRTRDIESFVLERGYVILKCAYAFAEVTD